MNRSIKISSGREAIAAFGEPRSARRLTTIRIREPVGDLEVIDSRFGKLDALRGVDFVAIEPDGCEYPYKIEIFNREMEETPGSPGHYRKKVPTRVIEIPEGVSVTCVTIDGGEKRALLVGAPHLLAVGVDDEVHPISREIFEAEFTWI